MDDPKAEASVIDREAHFLSPDKPLSQKQNENPGGTAKRRANSQRGITETPQPSRPPIRSVSRALGVLRTLNRLRIATLGDLYMATRLPKPTIVRILDTLIADGYVARDNMCGGYRISNQVRELNSGYEGIGEIIEAARLFAIDLTNQIKWPVSIGTLDGDAMLVQFWTGTISPWVGDGTLLRRRPNLITSAMGRSYMAFCSETERETILSELRDDPSRDFGPDEERQFRALLADIRKRGYALRAPYTEPRRNTTLAMPLRRDGTVLASMSVSFFTSAVPENQIPAQIAEPLRSTIIKIEDVMKFIRSREKLA